MDASPTNRCVIYCRVSSKKQLTEGDGLKSQELRCRQFAQMKNYEVLAVFAEQGISGGSSDRPAMQEMLVFLERQVGDIAVVVDDIKRFARDVEIHFDLKMALLSRGGHLESPHFHLDNSPESKFFETLFAAQAELERNQNKRQVLSRMKARLEQGFWVFKAPPGMEFKSDRSLKKVMMRDEPRATLVEHALKGYAYGSLSTPSTVMRYLFENGFFGPDPKYRAKRYYKVTYEMLSNVLYTGHLEYKKWGIPLQKGYHPALITLDEFDLIKQKLARTMTRPRTKRDVLFPARGYVLCDTCGKPLTASQSTGKGKQKYGYYHCFNEECTSFRKSVPKSRLEDCIGEMLKSLTVADTLLDALKVHVRTHWSESNHTNETTLAEKKERFGQLQTEIDNLTKRIGETNHEQVAAALTKRLEVVTEEQMRIQEKLATETPNFAKFDAALDLAWPYLREPYAFWEGDGSGQTRKLILLLVLAEPVRYDRDEGLRNLNLTLPYRVIGDIENGKLKMVDLTGETLNTYIKLLFEWSRILNRIGNPICV